MMQGVEVYYSYSSGTAGYAGFDVFEEGTQDYFSERIVEIEIVVIIIILVRYCISVNYFYPPPVIRNTCIFFLATSANSWEYSRPPIFLKGNFEKK